MDENKWDLRTAKDERYFIRAYEIESPPAPEIVR